MRSQRKTRRKRKSHRRKAGYSPSLPELSREKVAPGSAPYARHVVGHRHPSLGFRPSASWLRRRWSLPSNPPTLAAQRTDPACVCVWFHTQSKVLLSHRSFACCHATLFALAAHLKSCKLSEFLSYSTRIANVLTWVIFFVPLFAYFNQIHCWPVHWKCLLIGCAVLAGGACWRRMYPGAFCKCILRGNHEIKLIPLLISRMISKLSYFIDISPRCWFSASWSLPCKHFRRARGSSFNIGFIRTRHTLEACKTITASAWISKQ